MNKLKSVIIFAFAMLFSTLGLASPSQAAPSSWKSVGTPAWSGSTLKIKVSAQHLKSGRKYYGRVYCDGKRIASKSFTSSGNSYTTTISIAQSKVDDYCSPLPHSAQVKLRFVSGSGSWITRDTKTKTIPDYDGSDDDDDDNDSGEDPTPTNNGDSWNTSDPPTKDTSFADSLCKKSKDRFLGAYSSLQSKATSEDLDTLYHLERAFNGAAGLYEYTKDKEVANKMLDLAIKVINTGEDMNGDGYLDFCFKGADQDGCDDDPSLMPTYPWKAWHGLSKAFRVAADAGLKSSRSSDMEKLRKFLYNDVIDKWLDLDGAGSDKSQRGSQTNVIVCRMAGILLNTYLGTGDPKLGEMAREWVLLVAGDFEKSPKNSKAYIWDNYIKNGSEVETSDGAHTNEIITVLVEGFEAGFLPYSFLEPIQVTMLDIMWNNDTSRPSFRQFVDGSGEWSWQQMTMGWVRLAQFKGASQKALKNINQGSDDYNTIETNGLLCQAFGLAKTKYPRTLPKVTVSKLTKANPVAGTASESGKINCGRSKCSGGQKCCVVPMMDAGQESCTGSCNLAPIACDGPEDCSGNGCCGNFGGGLYGQGWKCSNSKTCGQMEIQLCHNNADCPGSRPYCCNNVQAPGLYFPTCSQFNCFYNTN